MSGDDRVTQAGAYLRMLLLRPGEYRAAWERHAIGTAADGIDFAAVASVLARPESPDGDLLRTVQEALDGTALSADVLDWFVSGFSLRRREADRLADLLRGSRAVRVITDDARPPSGMHDTATPARHETLSLHEIHVLGPDGRPAEHQTIQVIRSTVDGLDTLPYRFDTDELAVEVVRGGRVGDRVQRVSDSLYSVDILLDAPLAKDETALVQYRTTFFYKSPPAPEFRRGVLGTTSNLTIWLTFHRNRLPSRIWLARWDGIDHARVLQEEPVTLDDELSVHCRFDAVERAVVGFHWEWG